jgi:4-alpha-glucanotransferase
VPTVQRRAGILLHPTSLPGQDGIGELGRDARRWIDFLAAAGQRVWQVLPLGPTGYGDSPYQAFSSFAGNPYLISVEQLAEDGLLLQQELEPLRQLPRDRVDFGALIPLKLEVLQRAADRFELEATAQQRAALAAWTAGNGDWLTDFSLFMALKAENGGLSWLDWSGELRLRDAAALAQARERLAPGIARTQLWQWWFHQQWQALRHYAHGRGVQLLGDLPIFVAADSADAWANQPLLQLDASGRPLAVAGVPPDYFSATGQLWGNPLYDWPAHEASGFDWWIRRIRANLEFCDQLRIDHFRAFEANWSIPAGAETAETGAWREGPGQKLFSAVQQALGTLPLVAEDLGVITPAVEALRDDNRLPGMKILQFAFGGDPADPYLPHNYPRNCVVYTGTHDNDTTVGWYATLPEAERGFARRYLGCADAQVPWSLLRCALLSVAELAVIPLQDVLGLGSEARMNTPGSAAGNWAWRFSWEQPGDWAAPVLRDLAFVAGRAGTKISS